MRKAVFSPNPIPLPIPLLLLPFLFPIYTAQAQTTVEFSQKTSADVSTSPSGSNAAESLKLLFKALVPSQNSGGPPTKAHAFTVSGCFFPPKKWVAYVMGADVEHTFAFAKGCDLSGSVMFRHVPFPLALAIRHLEDYNQVKLTAEIKMILAAATLQAGVNFIATDGRLLAPSSPPTEFSGNYATSIGIDGTIGDNSGGTLQISKLRGKPDNSVTKLQF